MIYMEYQIKQILKIKGMTQKELAEKMGMSIQQLNNTISGRNTASMAVFERIAHTLDVEFWQMFAPDDMLGGVEHRVTAGITCPYCGRELKLTKAEDEPNPNRSDASS